MNKDQVKGRVEEAKGKVKESTGKVVGNRDLEAEGALDKAAGKAQKNYGDAKERSRTPSTRCDDGAEVEPIGETPAARQAAASARSMLPLSFGEAPPARQLTARRCTRRADVDRRRRRRGAGSELA